MSIIEYIPVVGNIYSTAIDHPILSAAALSYIAGNPRLQRALFEIGKYSFTRFFIDGGQIIKIGIDAYKQPPYQAKDVLKGAKKNALRGASAAAAAGRASAQRAVLVSAPYARTAGGFLVRAAANPITIGTSLAIGATTYGMVKQNPPPKIAFRRIPV